MTLHGLINAVISLVSGDIVVSCSFGPLDHSAFCHCLFVVCLCSSTQSLLHLAPSSSLGCTPESDDQAVGLSLGGHKHPGSGFSSACSISWLYAVLSVSLRVTPFFHSGLFLGLRTAPLQPSFFGVYAGPYTVFSTWILPFFHLHGLLLPVSNGSSPRL